MKYCFIILFISFSLFSCNGEKHIYMYEVSGTGDNYDVTFDNADGNTTSIEGVGNGWKYKWSEQSNIIGPERYLYIQAQNMNSEGGTVTVKIYKDGKVIGSNTSSGEFQIADCTK